MSREKEGLDSGLRGRLDSTGDEPSLFDWSELRLFGF